MTLELPRITTQDIVLSDGQGLLDQLSQRWRPESQVTTAPALPQHTGTELRPQATAKLSLRPPSLFPRSLIPQESDERFPEVAAKLAETAEIQKAALAEWLQSPFGGDLRAWLVTAFDHYQSIPVQPLVVADSGAELLVNYHGGDTNHYSWAGLPARVSVYPDAGWNLKYSFPQRILPRTPGADVAQEPIEPSAIDVDFSSGAWFRFLIGAGDWPLQGEISPVAADNLAGALPSLDRAVRGWMQVLDVVAGLQRLFSLAADTSKGELRFSEAVGDAKQEELLGAITTFLAGKLIDLAQVSSGSTAENFSDVSAYTDASSLLAAITDHTIFLHGELSKAQVQELEHHLLAQMRAAQSMYDLYQVIAHLKKLDGRLTDSRYDFDSDSERSLHVGPDASQPVRQLSQSVTEELARIVGEWITLPHRMEL